MKRLELTQHTLRCPMHDCAASVTVRTDSDGYPSRRHLDVMACSLLPSTVFLPSETSTYAYFPDMEPPVPYVYAVNRAPVHSTEVACPKRCLPMMNAAECGAAEPVQCSSGVCDSLELARQTQSPAVMRLLWSYTGCTG